MVNDVEMRPFVSGRLKMSSEGKFNLIGMKCNNCGEIMFPKERLCQNCSSEDVEEVILSDRGKIWSYTIVYETYGNLIGLTPPYGAAFVELPEGAYVYAPIVGCELEELKIGMDVELELWKIGEESEGAQQVAYVFKPVSR